MFPTCGIISPKSSTAVTDTIMATTVSTILSSRSGSASIAAAFASSSVTSSRCCLFTNGIKTWACLLSASFSELVEITVNVVTSRDSNPIVRPDIRPPKRISATEPNRYP